MIYLCWRAGSCCCPFSGRQGVGEPPAGDAERRRTPWGRADQVQGVNPLTLVQVPEHVLQGQTVREQLPIVDELLVSDGLVAESMKITRKWFKK
jgi:hypothetical protein